MFSSRLSLDTSIQDAVINFLSCNSHSSLSGKLPVIKFSFITIYRKYISLLISPLTANYMYLFGFYTWHVTGNTYCTKSIGKQINNKNNNFYTNRNRRKA